MIGAGSDGGGRREDGDGGGEDAARIEREAADALCGAASSAALAEVQAAVLGKRSALALAHRDLATLDADARRAAGKALHDVRSRLEALAADRARALSAAERSAMLERDRLDLTEVTEAEVRSAMARGRLHLVNQTQRELEDVFVAMGFTVAEGPEAETDWYNFEALNIPPAHPARSMWDTFYLELGQPETVVLRTHTSPVQVHLMEDQTPPIHAVIPGRCYRRETPDARHLPVFHQIEGLVVDHGVTFGDLAGTIDTFVKAIFGASTGTRLRPAYFPFTEPSAEFEITCVICGGAGCRTCGGAGWIELGGCGMVHPAVLEMAGVDPEVWTGFAFGFGIDRLAMMRHEIEDIRSLIENDVRFLSQF
ncbi:MAG TPA: phenylalanine--tRNA ligase subunit alpha [Acidimicrobiales bacterium]|nr:phenylalanine--tRNA ligase subunit alpha [Acidimicrobiales bacterium]